MTKFSMDAVPVKYPVPDGSVVRGVRLRVGNRSTFLQVSSRGKMLNIPDDLFHFEGCSARKVADFLKKTSEALETVAA